MGKGKKLEKSEVFTEKNQDGKSKKFIVKEKEILENGATVLVCEEVE
jgi:hypothetical protein